MKLTEERKRYIDGLSYYSLLSRWRNATGGDKIFMGETGDYWAKRMKELREEPDGDARHVSASKSIGWD